MAIGINEARPSVYMVAGKVIYCDGRTSGPKSIVLEPDKIRFGCTDIDVEVIRFIMDKHAEQYALCNTKPFILQ